MQFAGTITSYAQNFDRLGLAVTENFRNTILKYPLVNKLFNRGVMFATEDNKTILKGAPISKKPMKGLNVVRWTEQSKQLLYSNTIATVATTSVPVTAGTSFRFRAGDIVRIYNIASSGVSASTLDFAASANYAEFQVASVNTSTDVLTLTSAVTSARRGTLTVAASGQMIAVVGRSFKEGATVSDFRSAFSATKYNVFQDLRTPWKLTDVAASTMLDQGSVDPVAEEKLKQLEQHLELVETTLLFGGRYNVTPAVGGSVAAATSVFQNLPTNDNDSKGSQAMGGIMEYVYNTTNFQHFASSPTEAQLRTLIINSQRYGKGDKLILCGTTAYTFMSTLNTGKAYNTREEMGKAGQTIDNYLTFLGLAEFALEPVLKDFAAGAFDKLALIIDLDGITLYYQAGEAYGGDLDLMEREYVLANGETAVAGEWRSFLSLRVALADRFGWINGIA